VAAEAETVAMLVKLRALIAFRLLSLSSLVAFDDVMLLSLWAGVFSEYFIQ